MELYKIKQLNAYTWVIAEDLDVMVDTMYLVVGSRKAALIDTGAGIGDLRGLVESLTELPVMVLTTHLHTDHAGGNPLFEEIDEPGLPDEFPPRLTVEQSGKAGGD